MSGKKIFAVSLISMLIFVLFAGVSLAKEKVKIIDGNKAVKGKIAPRFEAETITGETFKLEEYRGKKCVVMTFWATWCIPCMKELPHLEKFYQKHKDTCVVLAVSKDAKGAGKLITNKVKELKLTFPVAHDSAIKIMNTLYPNPTVPYLVVIGRDGTVKEFLKGVKDPKALPAELEKILGDDLKPQKTEEAADSESAETKTEEISKEENPK